MAYTFEFDQADPITIDEYVDYIVGNVDLRDEEALKESAKSLFALSQNKTLFDHIIQEVISDGKHDGGLQELDNGYTDATFILAVSPDASFYVRANVWKKPSKVVGMFDYDNGLYSYHEPHDHNFDFVTVGYFGEGYRTRIYEYENCAIVGKLDEPVGMRFLEETTLPVGKVMMYRKSVDIHTQLPPEETSISLNLVVPDYEHRRAEQYRFDLERKRLSGYLPGQSSYQVLMLSLAGDIGGDDALEPLISIARRDACARTRAAAVESILKISPQSRELLLTYCGADPSSLVIEALGPPIG